MVQHMASGWIGRVVLACVVASVGVAQEGIAGLWRGDGLRCDLSRRDSGFAGHLSRGEASWALEAQRTDSGIAGTFACNGERFPFTAQLGEAGLVLQSGGAVYTLRRRATTSAPATRADAVAGGGNGEVRINGRVLDAATRQAIQRRYGVAPRPGRYWYDTRSGVYGVMGQPPCGFMWPGHDFGPVPSHASAGTTGVFVNGRNLPAIEVLLLARWFGRPALVGRYWLDGAGNYGVEGMALPLGNLLVQARRVGGRGGSNLWRSRLGAGNSNGSAGYVSVPGHGPIPFGM